MSIRRSPVAALLLSAAVLAAISDAATLDTHTVKLDGSSKIVPWTTDPADGYDRVVGLSWGLLKNDIPIDPANGLPVFYTHSEYDPDNLSGSGWPNNAAGKNAMLADSAALDYAYSGDEGVVDLVRGLLDHQLDHGTTPAGYAWAKVPWSTAAAGSISYGDDALREGAGILEPDKVGELGYHGYLRFYEITGDTRYRDAAIACADALAANIRPTGDYSDSVSPWPFRVVAQSGAIANGEELCGDAIAPIRLFDELIRLGLGNTAAYTSARADAWSWLVSYGLPDNAWANYFEDVEPIVGTGNVNQYNAGQTARYLLEHPELDPDWQAHAAGIIAWIEATFGGVGSGGESGLQYGARVISEQVAYPYKMASHTSRFAAINALYYARTGDAAAKEKAYRSLNWATYMCRDNGVVIEGPAEFAANSPCWFSDGHGDYIRHFLLAMGAVPEWAPVGESHLVQSTSAVRSVVYAPSGDAVAYSTFDPASAETLRLGFVPASVYAGGVALAERADLAAEGWVYDGAAGVLRVRHDLAGDVHISGGAPGNIPPVVELTSPLDAAEYEAPASVTLSATATDTDGTVASVDFYDGTTLVGSANAAPFTVAWTNVAPGSYTVRAYARDDGGAVVASGAAHITVTAPLNLPSPWQDADIGDVAAAGSANEYGGTFTVTGSGADIWNQADEFHFVYQMVSGDFELSARVVSLDDTGPWAMAGVMVRDGLTPGARHGIASMTRSQGWSFTWREQQGGSSSYTDGGPGATPAWVKLRRVGDELTAFRSGDGVSWTAFASATVSLPTDVYIGLAVSAVNDGALCTAVFDNVVIGPPSGGAIPDVSIDPTITYQTIDGFGVNANHRSWNGGELQPALDRLIDEAGFTLFRLVFDNSDWEEVNDNADPAVMNRAYYDSVYSSARFEPLWQEAAYLNSRGITDGLIFNFMGPGPDWLGGQTLDPGMEDEWAEMITSLLLYARNTRGIQFHLVAPDNEPDIFQEGIHTADAAQYAAALHALALRLDAEGLGDVRFVAPDRAGGGTGYIPELLADPVVMAKLAHFGLHSYSAGGGGSDGVAAAIASSSYPDRTFWMTEFNVWCPTCDGGVPGTYDWDYTRGTVEYLLDHIENGASAGIVWEGYDSSYAHHSAPWSFWGLLQVDNVNAAVKTYSPRKNFYTVAQVSRFVTTGDVRIEATTTVPGLRLFAFTRPSTGGVAIVGLNQNPGAKAITVDVSALPNVTQLQLVQTTSSLNLDYGSALPASDGQVTVEVAGDSVFTLTSEPIGTAAACPATPASCRTAAVSRLTIRNDTRDERDRIAWRWIKGDATAPEELGDPLTTDAYDVCVYDAGSLLMGMVAPAGGSCGGSVGHPKPCWKATRKGYVYSDKFLTPNGVRKVKLNGGDAGHATAVVSAKGANLQVPDLTAITGPLDVQLRRHDGGVCLGATFAAPFQKQDARRLSARSN